MDVNKVQVKSFPEDALARLKPDKDGFVEVSEIAAAGIVMDDQGNVWALPTNEFDQEVTLYTSKYKLPENKIDPRFAYEFHHKDEVAEMMNEKFVPVTRKELGIQDFAAPVTGTPLDTYHVVGGTDVCMKVPKQIRDARIAAGKRIADAAVASTEPPPSEDTGSNERLRSDKNAKLEVKQTHMNIRAKKTA